MSSKTNAFIVLCGGMGRRMGRGLPKMLLPLNGRPLLYWTLKNLERSSSVHAMVLAIPGAYRREFERKIASWKFKKIIALVDGGLERTDSTRNAFDKIPKEFKWIAIHDGARPLVSQISIAKCFSAAKKTGCAILAVPSKDTVKLVSKNGVIESTLERARCWSAQTPQIFRRDIAETMHGKSMRRHPQKTRFCTDDASIAETLGFDVRIVCGSYDNIKITTPEDLHAAQSLLRKFL